jgi:hypothetical protein
MIVGDNRERSEQSQLLFVLLEWLVSFRYLFEAKCFDQHGALLL